ncbi:hypothetical protein BDY19DRAFT_109739 [Irpex rosettiformis]|uniref:Uncharacterized protein n=1 Tax=Irpex rosettiformis TaxID=378272 RepID=A0ACB8U5B7_9APHY|nr:hypothetical protein BDY19DRAFT_109739 [Irpex rosettiformis]
MKYPRYGFASGLARRGCLSRTVMFRYSISSWILYQRRPRTCSVVSRTIETLSLVQFFIFAVFSSLRVYALWGRNISLGVMVLLLALVPMVANAYNDATYTLLFETGILPIPVCGNTFGLSPSLVFRRA